MIAIACGSREYRLSAADYDLLSALPITLLYQGGASGADAGAAEWAMEEGVETRTIRANWKLYKKSAGPLRNAAMLKEALAESAARGQLLIIIAFPGGKGTADMLRKGRSAGVPCLFVPGGYKTPRGAAP